MADKKKQGEDTAKADTPAPQPTAEERAGAVRKLVEELRARPDAQVRIVAESLPTLSRLFNVDIPEVDMGIREEVSPAAPGPMSQHRLIDPKTLTNADAGQGPKYGPPSGGIEGQTILAVGKAVGHTEGKPLDRGTKVKGLTPAEARKANANRAAKPKPPEKKKAAAKKPSK